MNIHEYQAREILKEAGIPVPGGILATTPKEARKAAETLGGMTVVKAQVHTGGRGKAGGVKLAKTPQECEEKAGQILGMSIRGHTVRKVLVGAAVDIDREVYASVTLDRASEKPMFLVSAAGGVDIEEVAAKTPEKIVRQPVDPLVGACAYETRALAARLFDRPEDRAACAQILARLYQVYAQWDCSLAEINPLVRTKEGKVLAIDAKISFDDNALYRQKRAGELRDPDEEDPNEARAKEKGLSFVSLDGDIGCIVNGAGLAMATMDVVKLSGGNPANFLDVGGSSDPSKVVRALQIITSNPKVKAILFNIFGGITRCDDVAKGILQALKEIQIRVPVVVRLTGTNEEEARRLLVGTKLIPAATMDEAVDRVVKEAKR